MHIVTAGEMRAIDRHAIEETGIPALVLMENAGRAIAEEAARLAWRAEKGAWSASVSRPETPGGKAGAAAEGCAALPTTPVPAVAPMRADGDPCGRQKFRWRILVGKGNNGGDGLVCARHLLEMGFDVGLLYAVERGQLTGEAAVQRDIAEKWSIPWEVYDGGRGSDAGRGNDGNGGSDGSDAGRGNDGNGGSDAGKTDWRHWDGIIDALLGTGTKGQPREPYRSLIAEANASGLPIVAADIPSGLDADTGGTPGPCVRASLTVALAYAKRGLYLHPGAEYAGEVVVRAIGMPPDAAERHGVATFALDARLLAARFDWRSVPPERRADTHKGTYGHVLVVAGSAEMSGAGYLSCRAALRGGSGLVSWAVPAGLAARLTGLLPEAMLRTLADGGSGAWDRVKAGSVATAASGKQAVVVGPGLGRWAGDAAWLSALVRSVRSPLVVDADALNMAAEGGLGWKEAAGPVVVTPHPGEMARLCGLSVAELQRDRIGIARKYAAEHNVVVVLKGAGTVIAAPGGAAYVNTTGNPGMATGGAGDVLAGIIGSLLGQGLDAVRAAVCGVYWHGLAGDRAAGKRPSAASLVASDIIEAL